MIIEELVKDVWSEEDREGFLELLRSFSKPDKVEWSRRIINTELPLLAIPTPQLRTIAKSIEKGNFIGFLDLNTCEYYDSISIRGMLITKIKDFELMKKYLIDYAEHAENWATCDLLKFPVKPSSRAAWWSLANELAHNAKPFARRVGMCICFQFIETEYLDAIFDLLREFESEKEYYVNMVNAWLVAECFAKAREKTLAFFASEVLNTFTQNKAVSKCRDSYRVSAEDKERLLAFKK